MAAAILPKDSDFTKCVAFLLDQCDEPTQNLIRERTEKPYQKLRENAVSILRLAAGAITNTCICNKKVCAPWYSMKCEVVGDFVKTSPCTLTCAAIFSRHISSWTKADFKQYNYLIGMKRAFEEFQMKNQKS